MKAWTLAALFVLPCGGLLVVLELWRRKRARDNQADLVPRWRNHFSSGPATGEPAIPAANLPPIVTLKAVKVERVSRFRARLAR